MIGTARRGGGADQQGGVVRAAFVLVGTVRFNDLARRMAEHTAAPPNDEAARILAESIVDTIRQPLLILNEDLTVRSANRALYDAFQVERAETEGRPIFELGNGQWDIPRLRELLSEVLPQRQTVEGFEIEHSFDGIGERVMLVSARTLPRTGVRTQATAGRAAYKASGRNVWGAAQARSQ